MESLDWTTADQAAQDDLPEEGADVAADVPSDTVDTPPTATSEEKEETFFDPKELSEELQAEWKRMQAGFTKARQRDREQVRAAQEKVQLVDRLNSDPQFARQLVEFLAPKVGVTLASGQQAIERAPAPARADTMSDAVSQALAEKLGPELAFLAPALAEAVSEATRAAVSPFERKQVEQETMTRAQQEAARRAEEDRLMAELDQKLPNWEAEYGGKMEALDAFLASDQLVHPEFGSKYELYLRLLNPDAARATAIRDMQDATRRGVRTGRTGSPTRGNVLDRVKEAHQNKGWNEMWNVIQQNPDAILDALGNQ